MKKFTCVQDIGNLHEAVAEALARLEANYESYRQAALAFYDSVDNTDTMKRLVEDAFSRTKAEK